MEKDWPLSPPHFLIDLRGNNSLAERRTLEGFIIVFLSLEMIKVLRMVIVAVPNRATSEVVIIRFRSGTKVDQCPRARPQCREHGRVVNLDSRWR